MVTTTGQIAPHVEPQTAPREYDIRVILEVFSGVSQVCNTLGQFGPVRGSEPPGPLGMTFVSYLKSNDYAKRSVEYDTRVILNRLNSARAA